MDAHEGATLGHRALAHDDRSRDSGNDPHWRSVSPVRGMITHLAAPGFNLVGAGPAWLPGRQFGHTDRIAFGETIFRSISRKSTFSN